MSTFGALGRNVYGAILADPGWHFATWSKKGRGRSPKYRTMSVAEIAALPVVELAAPDCVLFLWATWPLMPAAFHVVEAWGFKYKTCAFTWLKADPDRCPVLPFMGNGYWTRANVEVCLLAVRGRPQRLHADVRQAIVAPRRAHSQKPDEIYGRIERLVAGPYCELFARTRRKNWAAWGDELPMKERADD
jgi:N6-adenosine-specific RNA methylase IME4